MTAHDHTGPAISVTGLRKSFGDSLLAGVVSTPAEPGPWPASPTRRLPGNPG